MLRYITNHVKMAQRNVLFLRHLRVEQAFLFITVLCILYTNHHYYDIWWHLQVGRDILETMSLPRNDTYSYTAYGESWCVHSWLSSIFFYVLFLLFGQTTFKIVELSVHALALYVAYGLTNERNRWLSYLVVILFAFLLSWREARPFVFTPLLLLLILRLVTSSYTTPSLYPNVSVFILSVLWVNLHGSAYVFIALLCVAYILSLVLYIVRMECIHSYLKVIGVRIGFSILGVFCNPHPFELINRTLSANQYPTADWAPLLTKMDSFWGWMLIVVFFFALGLFLL